MARSVLVAAAGLAAAAAHDGHHTHKHLRVPDLRAETPLVAVPLNLSSVVLTPGSRFDVMRTTNRNYLLNLDCACRRGRGVHKGVVMGRGCRLSPWATRRARPSARSRDRRAAVTLAHLKRARLRGRGACCPLRLPASTSRRSRLKTGRRRGLQMPPQAAQTRFTLAAAAEAACTYLTLVATPPRAPAGRPLLALFLARSVAPHVPLHQRRQLDGHVH
jgi:hypothetical protein